MTSRTPVPRTVYVHDDLSDELRARGEGSRAWCLGQDLIALLRDDGDRVVVLTLAQQLDALVRRGAHAPFAVAIGIGRAGARVAEQVHARAGWFPAIHRVDVWREEDGGGRYVLAGPAPVAAQLPAALEGAAVAVVDDTIYSGLTMRAVLGALSSPRPRRLHAFCLRAVARSLEEVARLAPVTAGIAAPGRMDDDVTFINASGLVRRGAIRRAGRPPLAFFERPEWLAAWFPGRHQAIVALCRQLHAELDGQALD
jgi:pyrimidine operon attenuation protein/uracil phosphoribosyltransferase